MSKIPIALELYSVRDQAASDLFGVLKAVAKMGYAGVEFAGYHGHDAASIRKVLDDTGLKCYGGHLGIHTLMGEELERTVEFQATLGNAFLIVPGLPHDFTYSKAAWLKTAHAMNEIADRLKPHGMFTGYHNHHTEFHDMDGELPWDIFFGNTKKEVIMQFDTGNALIGGAEAAPFIRRYPGRARTVHLKEHSETNPEAPVGEGSVDWKEIFSLCETVGGTEVYVVEHESGSDPMSSVEICLKNLHAMGK